MLIGRLKHLVIMNSERQSPIREKGVPPRRWGQVEGNIEIAVTVGIQVIFAEVELENQNPEIETKPPTTEQPPKGLPRHQEGKRPGSSHSGG